MCLVFKGETKDVLIRQYCYASPSRGGRVRGWQSMKWFPHQPLFYPYFTIKLSLNEVDRLGKYSLGGRERGVARGW